VCILIPAWFGSNTALLSYFFAKEVDGRKSTGFFTAAILAIVPGIQINN
jgi:asparagine N-glycosylation enzyme membrane subunit Stt3